ncbi:MAG TPA: glycerate-2-kinase family protein, partial [Gemmatimonadales bacterium]|nr:glycerate-2-kinase family protein [Gemmatimonadales bacterium]
MPATPSPADPRALLTDLYWAAVTAAAPGPAVDAALASTDVELKRRVHIIALGKAAHPMAAAAVARLRERGVEPAGGIVVSPTVETPPHPGLAAVPGDHPVPGRRSLDAAARLGEVARRVRPEDEAWVLLSGGATSLVGAPVDGVSPADLASLYRLLLGSGLDIAAMNAVRKRFSRWGAGRLAVALRGARVKNFTISDVIGDDLASIGSGPCVPDETSAAEVRSLLTSAALWGAIPEAMRRMIAATERGELPETPKPGDPAFEGVEVRLVASNRLALAAAARRATALGIPAHIVDAGLAGEAAEAGRRVARYLLDNVPARIAQPELHNYTACFIWGGETTVTLGPGAAGLGGRNQELAL